MASLASQLGQVKRGRRASAGGKSGSAGVGKHQIYDYLLKRHKKLGYQKYDNFTEAAKITGMIRGYPAETADAIAVLIYSLMLHHEKLTTAGASFKSVLYDGHMLGKGAGIRYDTRSIPPLLTQLIFIMVGEIADGTFPYLGV
jgi:hypothetical protein